MKKECLVEFNPFFYHYSRIQHSKVWQWLTMVLKVKYYSFYNIHLIDFLFLLLVLQAEESQKKRRAQECNDKGDPNFTLNRQLCRKMWQIWTCPAPPPLHLLSALCPPVPPAFCSAFSSVVHLLDCEIFIHILRRVLQRALEDRTEAMVQRVRAAHVDFIEFAWLWSNTNDFYHAGAAPNRPGSTWRENTAWRRDRGGSDLWF